MNNECKDYMADRVLKLLFRALKGESLSVYSVVIAISGIATV